VYLGAKRRYINTLPFLFLYYRTGPALVNPAPFIRNAEIIGQGLGLYQKSRIYSLRATEWTVEADEKCNTPISYGEAHRYAYKVICINIGK